MLAGIAYFYRYYMFEELFKNIRQKIAITEKEEDICRSLFIPKKFRKKQYLLQQGDVCKYTAFVEKGLLRSYIIDDKGTELIMQFAPEGWWIGDLYSSLTGEVTEYNIDAIENTETLLLTNQGYEQLMQQAPVFERYFRLLIQNSFIAMQRRLKGNIILNAEEKYKNFIHLYPNIVQRVPQHNIASFLGITPESLSRIRRQMTER
ncbi:MAG: Crp/Fnr family transcriptional regulator [Chitinophagaceae bacterium]|nr:Crp/Fnr family transcriptional regulator [Chitinophagaceae bacterium]